MQLTDFFHVNNSKAKELDFLLPICHGFACACACLGTQTIEEEQWQLWWESLVETLELNSVETTGSANNNENNFSIDADFIAFDSELFTVVRAEAAELEIQFNEQERIWLPFKPHPENEELSDWAAAFMIVVMQDAEFWHQNESMDEALLPVVVFSGLFEDDQIKAIEDDEELLFDMAEEIPELLTDIYLLLNGD